MYCILIISAHLPIPALFTHGSENSSGLGNWFTQESPAPSQRKQNLLLGLVVSSALPLRFGFCLDLFCSLLLCSYLSPSLDHRSAHEWVHLPLSAKDTGKSHHGFMFTNTTPLNTCISGKYLNVQYVSMTLVLPPPYIIQDIGDLLNVMWTIPVFSIWSDVEWVIGTHSC